jgi:2-haloacid dehalogenase
MTVPYSTILFDLDHTLFDSDASEAQAFAHALTSSGVDEPSRHFPAYSAINRALWAAVERGELATAEVKVRRFEELVHSAELAVEPHALADAFAAGMGRFGALYPGAREVLATLAARDAVTLALVTNGLSEVQRARVARLELDAYFDAIVVSSEIGAAKPATAIFDVTFAQLGGPARATALMIGDSLTSDLQGGRNYGIATCWYNPHRRAVADRALIDHEIASLDQVLALVA